MAKPPSVKPWRTVVRRQLEKDIEKRCKAWANARGWWVRKFKSPGNRSVPDAIFAKQFLHPDGSWASRKLAVEFKKLKKTSTDKQIEQQELMRAAGWEVYEIDSCDKFVALFEKIEAEEKLATEESWLHVES